MQQLGGKSKAQHKTIGHFWPFPTNSAIHGQFSHKKFPLPEVEPILWLWSRQDQVILHACFDAPRHSICFAEVQLVASDKCKSASPGVPMWDFLDAAINAEHYQKGYRQ